MPVTPDPVAIAGRFNDCITAADLDALTDLMTADHTFIDTAGHLVSGRDACRAAWRDFFAAFPGYRNIFTSMTAVGTTVAITGYSICSVPDLAGPALWTATIRGPRLARWQVYQDTPANRDRIGRASG